MTQSEMLAVLKKLRSELLRYAAGNDSIVPGAYAEALDAAIERYHGKDEDPVTKWRRRHKRCCFCKHCRPIGIVPFTPRAFTCTAKGKAININTPRPFCGLFELRKEESND